MGARSGKEDIGSCLTMCFQFLNNTSKSFFYVSQLNTRCMPTFVGEFYHKYIPEKMTRQL